MLIPFFAAITKTSTVGPQIRHELAAELQGIPLRGDAFQAKVNAILGRHPMPAAKFYEGGLATSFVQPANWPDATIVSIDETDIQFLIHMDSGGTKVDLLSDNEDNFPTITVREAYRFGNDLVEINSFGGADHDKPEARVYYLSKGRWRHKQTLDAVNENADHPFPAQVHGQRLSLTMDERAAPRNFMTCHVCPWLRYRERWEYHDGRIHQVSLRRLPTPLAKLDDLIGQAHRHQKSAFAEGVAKPIRAKAWRILSGLYQDDGGFESLDQEREEDEGTILKNFDHVFVFKSRAGKWILAEIKPKAKAK